MTAAAKAGRTALVAGGTGLVGGLLLRRLAADGAFGRVVAVGRRAPSGAPTGVEPLVVDLASFAGAAAVKPPRLPSATDAFCALWTTIRAAGSQEKFRAFDHGLVLAFAKAALAAGAKRFLLVSSLGADPGSSNFYLRVKGEAERDVTALAFEGVAILRPSLLLGERRESRPGERAAALASRALSFAFVGPLARYRPIEADEVAAAMVALARGEMEGRIFVESEEIRPRGSTPPR